MIEHRMWCAATVRANGFDATCDCGADPDARPVQLPSFEEREAREEAKATAATRKLPVLNERSHAASTAFCLAEVTSPDDPGRVLYVDGSGKITRDGGSYAQPAPNAFSLVQVDDCPHSTPTCREGCYVHNLEAAAKATHDRYRSNSALIREILHTDPDHRVDTFRATTWALALARWIRANTSSFRWHVSGDIWSARYAGWIADVVELSPKTEHWIYTRSFKWVSILSLLPNLSINLSADQDNYSTAMRERRAWEGTDTGRRMRIAYYTRTGGVPADLPDDSIIFPDYSLRGGKGLPAHEQRAQSAWWQGLTGDQRRMVCPVDFYGAAEDRRCGPCSRCL